MASIAGTLIRGDTRPKVPKFTPIDYTGEQSQAILGNLKNLDNLSELGSKTTEQLMSQLLASMEKFSPGLLDLITKNTANLKRGMAGEVPLDVENMLKRKGAEMGVSTGTIGSDFNKYGTLRNLGLTSLDIINKSQDSFARWMDSIPKVSFDFTRMFQSPAERVQLSQWNTAMKWNRDWLSNQIKALPNQYQEAAAGFFDTVEETGRSFLTSWGSKQAGM